MIAVAVASLHGRGRSEKDQLALGLAAYGSKDQRGNVKLERKKEADDKKVNTSASHQLDCGASGVSFSNGRALNVNALHLASCTCTITISWGRIN